MPLIIYAEDDPLMGEIVRETLAEDGHIVGIVPDGNQALAAIKAKKPDLVILDCSMPELPGVEVLRKLRLSPEFYDMPVLMLTARTSINDMDLAFQAGADDYLKKPFEPAELLNAVEDLLKASNRKPRKRC